MHYQSGLDVLVANQFMHLRGARVGLVTHPAAVSSSWISAADAFLQSPLVELKALFGPEHGLSGEEQDLIPAKAASAPVRCYSLYGESFESLKPTSEMLKDLDALAIDLQDVGSRYYTFQATMLYCLEASAEIGLPVYLLDRPNPLGRTVEGPTILAGFESFVGPHPVCTRHGMTMGELAKLYQAERVPKVNLRVVPFEGWNAEREYAFAVPPSPNMPSLNTARVYPGMCLFEGTNISEGRGTTRPFEYIGFPGLDGRAIADEMNASGLPGFRCLPVSFRPTFQKHAGRSCGGVFVHVSDPGVFRSVATGLLLLMNMRRQLGEKFRWRTETYEFISHIPAIDLLFGSDRERTMIERGASFDEIIATWPTDEDAFRQRRKPYLIESA